MENLVAREHMQLGHLAGTKQIIDGGRKGTAPSVMRKEVLGQLECGTVRLPEVTPFHRMGF
jgi:hypothetical protein